jgi:hypothetical protein
MAKDAAPAWIGAGGPLSKLHAAVKPGTENSAVRSKTTADVWTTVTGGITFLEVFRRSAVTQAVSHDRETITKPMASAADLSMAECSWAIPAIASIPGIVSDAEPQCR